MDHPHNKKAFQLERFVLFSDAVFAIAITLLVIDLKVPEIPRELVTEQRLLEALNEQIPRFVGFALSFFIIGLFWTIHHRIFGYVKDYTPKMLRLNLVFLFCVVLMPFSTSFYAQYIYTRLITPAALYVGNICFLGIMNIFLWRYVSNPKNHLCEGLHPEMARYFILRAITMPATFLGILLIYIFVEPVAALIFFPFIPLIIGVFTRKQRKKVKNLPPYP